MLERASSSAAGEVPGLPGLADALPGAEHACTRAVAHLEGRAARGDLLESLVALLESAGGPDVGNLVRTHLERTGAAVPAPRACDSGRLRVLLAALRLHRVAEDDLRLRLRSAGLVDQGGPDDPDRPSGRPTRAWHTERVLSARRSAVDQVVAALAGVELSASAAGPWVDALVGDLPPDLLGRGPSQGETDSGAGTG